MSPAVSSSSRNDRASRSTAAGPCARRLRGPREVLELWVTERALKAEPWLREARPGARHQVKPERDLTEAAGTRDHQGVLAWAEPYRYADAYELAAASRRCSSASTRSQTRTTSAQSRARREAAGATGVVVPAHNAARVTPAVVRASAGAIEHLPVAVVQEHGPLPLGGEGPAALGLGRRRRRETPLWQADLTGGVALVLGAEGKGVRPLVRRTCDAAVSIPLAGEVESLNVSVAAGVLLYEAAQAAQRIG